MLDRLKSLYRPFAFGVEIKSETSKELIIGSNLFLIFTTILGFNESFAI